MKPVPALPTLHPEILPLQSRVRITVGATGREVVRLWSKRIEKETNVLSRCVLIILIAGVASWAGPVDAEEGTVTFHDPSCGFFILKLPGDAGYGLYESRSGPTPAVGHVMEGNLVEGKEIEVINKTVGAANRLIHWANAPAPVTLIRNFPFQCTSRWQLRQ